MVIAGQNVSHMLCDLLSKRLSFSGEQQCWHSACSNTELQSNEGLLCTQSGRGGEKLAASSVVFKSDGFSWHLPICMTELAMALLQFLKLLNYSGSCNWTETN